MNRPINLCLSLIKNSPWIRNGELDNIMPHVLLNIQSSFDIITLQHGWNVIALSDEVYKQLELLNEQAN